MTGINFPLTGINLKKERKIWFERKQECRGTTVTKGIPLTAIPLKRDCEIWVERNRECSGTTVKNEFLRKTVYVFVLLVQSAELFYFKTFIKR